MIRITRSEVLRKCIIVFDALKRVASKGNAGLEAAWGAEDEFAMDEAVAAELRQMLREMEAGESRKTEEPDATEKLRMVKAQVVAKGIRAHAAEWQRDIMENGVPERLDLK